MEVSGVEEDETGTSCGEEGDGDELDDGDGGVGREFDTLGNSSFASRRVA